MAAVDASVAGTAHGTLTINTPEVISFGTGGKVAVENRGTTVMYGQTDVTDLTLAAQGTEAIAPGETLVFYRESGTAGTICLKSSAAVPYSISRAALPRVGGGGGAGGAVSGEVELGATSLAALESITVVDGGGSVTVDGTVEIGATSLAALESITVVDGGGSVTVDGSVTADTELPAAAALSDTTANPTAPMVGAAVMYWDGGQWLRWQRFIKELTVTAATLASVAGSASSVTVFGSNSAARGRAIHNDSAAALYLKFGATATTTSYTVRLDADVYYEFPSPLYTGIVDGIWASATGSARTTET